MAWVKRNLGLVIGGAIALVLMALAGYYFWTKYQADQDVTAQLEDTTQKFQTLLQRPVHPGTEGGKINNIQLAKDENKRLMAFLEGVRAKFGQRDIPAKITNRDFRALLDNTINELQKDAESQGIKLPDKDYWFTFAPERSATEFKAIDMLAHELWDVKDLCEILYAAKIHDLKAIRRVPASSDDNNTTDFITEKKASTNDVAIVTPYEIKFQGFSSELARVLEGLVNAKHCFIVRNVAVDKAPPDEATPATPPPMLMNPGMLRYMNRYARPAAPVIPQNHRPPNVLLDEDKLLVVLQIDAIRLKELPGSKKEQKGEKQVAQSPRGPRVAEAQSAAQP